MYILYSKQVYSKLIFIVLYLDQYTLASFCNERQNEASVLV